jgi:hypothetical protein
MLLWAVDALGIQTTYTVTNTKNSGAGSLRQAILDANADVGSRITFAAGLSGSTIAPASPLPAIIAEATTIDGDLNDDGKPDIRLDGYKLTSGVGLTVRNSPGCEVIGLCITGFPDTGLLVRSAPGVEVRSCYLGATVANGLASDNGWAAGPSGEQLELLNTDGADIGGATAKDRNCFSCGSPAVGNVGLRLVGSQYNQVMGNFIGLFQDGTGAWANQNDGIVLEPSSTGRKSSQNIIGGQILAGTANYLGGCETGITLYRSPNNTISGNYFGLAKNRSTALPMASSCVYVGEASSGNVIGGPPNARNVFVSEDRGVVVAGPNATNTTVASNYFGTNGAGTAERTMGVCVDVLQSSGPQMIGGDDPSLGNYFAPNGTAQPTGVELWGSGTGPVIQYNIFGELPGAGVASQAAWGVYVYGASPQILGNRIGQAQTGLDVQGSSSNPQVYNNAFLNCTTAVKLETEAHCRLGNLTNTSTNDNGGNIFSAIATWFVYNDTPNAVKAEGNDFGTTSNAAINAQVYDKVDNASLGRVDYNPLSGGVRPTGGTEAVFVSSVAAVPTAGGAEIAFSLSAPARVTVSVLNIAGRPIAALAQERAVAAGLQRLAWNGQSATGARAPSGVYLVTIEARSATGATSRALTRLALGR